MEERAESIAERSLSKGASDEDMFAISTCFQLYTAKFLSAGSIFLLDLLPWRSLSLPNFHFVFCLRFVVFTAAAEAE